MMAQRSLRNLQRWWQVQSIFLRYGFDILVDQHEIQEVRRFLREKLNREPGEMADRSTPEKVRLMLEELGPTYIKLGQMASSRSNIMPDEWYLELSRLQNEVAAFPADQVCAAVGRELGSPPEDLFKDFDYEPLGAASIGQVHTACLASDEPVVVKVQRPGIRPQIEADLEIIREAAYQLEKRTALGRKYGVTGVVDEFARSLMQELDYQNEGRNADRLLRNMATIPEVQVPFIYWNLSTDKILTMERIYGVKINDVDAMDRAGLDRKKLADVFINSVVKQILIDGFFHADPHPGNVLVNLETGVIVFIDLGMMGQLAPDQREDLGAIMQALQRRDTPDMVRIAMEVGMPYQPVDELKLRRSLDRIFDRYLEQSLSDIAFADMMSEILEALFDHGIRLPTELTLALKALIQSEEVARTLNPDIEIIDVARQAAQQLFMEQIRPEVLFTRFGGELRDVMRLTRLIRTVGDQLLRQLQNGDLVFKLDMAGIPDQIQRLNMIANRVTAGVILVGMVIGSALAMGISPEESWSFIPAMGMVGFILSMVLSLMLVVRVLMDIWRGE